MGRPHAGHDTGAVLAAAGRALGTELSGPAALRHGPANAVLRCRTAHGRSVIVKAFSAGPEGRRGFTGEAAGLALGLGGPALLAVDDAVPLVVMADLGPAPTLEDVLSGGDREAGERALLAWARSLGRQAARSVGRAQEFARLWAAYGRGRVACDEGPWIARNAERFLALLAAAGLAAPPGLAGELEHMGRVGAALPVFTPGDTCPYNTLITPAGARVVDFELCCYRSVFLAAAYLRMPFAGCRRVRRLPEELAHRVEEVFRAEAAAGYPQLAGDALWRAGMRAAVAVWTVDATVCLLPRAGPLPPAAGPARTVAHRRRLAYRWERGAELTQFPAFARTMRTLLRELAAGWEVAPLPVYPAFAPAGRPAAAAQVR